MDTLPEGRCHPHGIFNQERHLVDRKTYKARRTAALTEWRQLAAWAASFKDRRPPARDEFALD
jgi:hypothetical protein